MDGKVPERLWLPLFVLHNAGTLYSKTKAQKLIFLAQYKSHLLNYDFEQHRYGPYSHLLSADMTCYPSLIRYQINPSVWHPARRYYSFELTDGGEKVLHVLLKGVDRGIVKSVKATLDQYAHKRLPVLLDEVYRDFALGPKDSSALEATIRQELEAISPAVSSSFQSYKNRQSFFLLTILQSLQTYLDALTRTTDTVARGVVLNLVRETTHKIQDVADDVIPPADSITLRPKFIEIADLESFLSDYCEQKRILPSLLRGSLEDVMKEDEAKRLSKALAELELPA